MAAFRIVVYEVDSTEQDPALEIRRWSYSEVV